MMHTRPFTLAASVLVGITSLFLAGITAPLIKAAEFSTRSKPNVLMIAVDVLNDWIGCMGGHPQAITPNIDRLAKEGVVFLNNHCQAPICGPSRASLMTGLYPSTTGIYLQIKDVNIQNLWHRKLFAA